MLRIRLSPKGNKRNKIFTIDVINSKKKNTSKPIDRIGYIDRKNNKNFLNINKYMFFLNKGANIKNKKLKIFLNKLSSTKNELNN